ncbi:trna ligase [Coemansia sp. RSA 2131]|nr:trna ligase [Coemansia sp. RSA 2131]
MSTDSITSVNWGSLTRKEQTSFEQLLLQLNEHVDVAPASKKVVGKTISEFAGREVTSWKSTDYLYKKEPCPLPSQARGLFTCTEGGEVRIAARGYNKFFNINEVPKTNWSWIEDNTHGPYEMTVKEDGCLILASGLDGGKTLLVTSKHAIVVPHAQMGRQWMEQHLNKAGKTVVEFATFLYERNATAVFELCDDAFEEHILEYPERTRGLYLHGINRNSVELDTWPSTEVAKVAEYFGFNVVKRFEFNSALEGRELADSVRKDEMLEGRVIEGFVMRCKLNGTDEPYMFKIKYDIPYLMFREWRVVTDCIFSPEFRRIMNGNIRAFAPLDLESESDKLINEVIELDSLADSAENLQVAVEALCKMFPDTLKLPSESEVNEALDYALAFEPEVQVVADSKADKK